jgi:hypothetical protein
MQFYKRFINDPNAIYSLIKEAIFHVRKWFPAFPNIEKVESIPKMALKSFLDDRYKKPSRWGSLQPTKRTIAKSKINKLIGSLAHHITMAMVIYLEVEHDLSETQIDIFDWTSIGTSMRNNMQLKLGSDGRSVVPPTIGSTAGFTKGLNKEILKNFPEAEDFIKAMDYLYKSKHWRPNDLHSGNIMIRPKTKNFVVTDLGLFEFV